MNKVSPNIFLSTSVLCFFVLCLGLCTVKKAGTTKSAIQVRYPIYPVIRGDVENPLLRIRVDGNKVQELSALKLSISDESANRFIDGANLFYTGNDSAFSDKVLLNSVDVGSKVVIMANKSLADGGNYFWISIKANENTPIDWRFTVQLEAVVLDGKKIKSGFSQAPVQRMGLALRRHGDDNVHTFRIPGLATTNHGTLIAVYDARYNNAADLQEDVDVAMSRSVDGGKSWEAMRIIMDRGTWGGLPQGENGVGDPTVLVDKATGTIWVAGLWAHGMAGKRMWNASGGGLSPNETGQFLLVKSDDDGLTWSEPINITKQVKDPSWHLFFQGPGKGISMSNGTLVFPAQFRDSAGMPYSTIIYSKDHGKTWHAGTGAKSNTTEAQVVELEPGTLMLNMRDNRGGARSVAISLDMGKTWTEHPTSRKALPEPVCMASLIKHSYKGKEYLIFSNPNSTKGRRHMTIKVSADMGMTWPEEWHTLIDQGYGRGYSCLTSIGENAIGIVYEGSKADLVFQCLSFEDLID